MEFMASSLLCVNIFFVKALRQWSQIREAMKRRNIIYGKKLKQWSDEAFNAGKEIEAMKRLTLHRFITSSLHRFCWPSFALGHTWKCFGLVCRGWTKCHNGQMQGVLMMGHHWPMDQLGMCPYLTYPGGRVWHTQQDTIDPWLGGVCWVYLTISWAS